MPIVHDIEKLTFNFIWRNAHTHVK